MHLPIRPSLTLLVMLLVALLSVAAPVAAPAAAHDPSPKPSPGRGAPGGSAAGPELFGARSPTTGTAAAPLATMPEGFHDQVQISGLDLPVNVAFASNGRVFIAEKSGVIKTYSSLTDATPAVVADLSAKVFNFWDRGMLGLALDPDFPSTPHLYVLYSYNRAPGATAPMPGTELGRNDDCPNPPVPFGDGCLATGILSRLVLRPSGSDWVMDRESAPLLRDWCQQVAWHSIGTVLFGPDGMLYAGGGEGAYADIDYGWHGGGAGSPTPKNPCQDPPYPSDIEATDPGTGYRLAEGGALRALDVRTRSDPTSLSGTIVRIDPQTGQGALGNPWYGDSEPNVRRIVAYGLRNPYRFIFRPGTATPDLWIGDVGQAAWEEIDHLADPAGRSAPANFGWPCYEGDDDPSDDGTPSGRPRQNGFDARNLRLCETLYAQGVGAVKAPHWAYLHAAATNPDGLCPAGGAAIAGMAFYTGSSYPAEYRDALFFADYNRNCITVIPAGSNGLPDPAQRRTFIGGAPGPVQLMIGPNGDLFYLALGDFGQSNGSLHRITYVVSDDPIARINATPESGDPPLDVDLDGSASSDPDGGALTYAWDLDGDSALDDGMSAQVSWRYGDRAAHAATGDPAAYPVTLEVTDPVGDRGSTTKLIVLGEDPPDVSYVSDRPWTSATEAWGPPERDRSNGEMGAADGRPITLGGVVYRKGVGLHALAGAATLASEIRLPVPRCTRFISDIGVDDETGAFGSVHFQVWAVTPTGDQKLYDTTTTGGQMTGDSPTRTVDVALPSGTTDLRLDLLNSNGVANSDHGDWAGARLLCESNARPRPTIETPPAGTQWSVGERIDFEGLATDREDGNLPPDALTWALSLHHCSPVDPSSCHAHALRRWDGVATGFFTAPDHEYPSHLELTLTATDSLGASRTASVLLHPRTAQLSLRSSPSGIELTAGATAEDTPFDMTAIVGSEVPLSAPREVQRGGTTYGFVEWSDGGARDHTVRATADRTLTARYVPDRRPDTCSAAKSDSATGTWLQEAIHEGDDDWFRFSQPSSGWVRIVLGRLPADYALELYGSCGGTRIARSDRSGRSFEELYRYVPTGRFRVGVLDEGDQALANYSLLVQRLPGRPLVVGTTSWRSGDRLRIAGDVLNDSTAHRTNVRVRIRLLDASGVELARHDIPVHARILGSRKRSSFFADLARPPGYARLALSVLSRTTSQKPRAGLRAVLGAPRTVPADPDAVRYRGTVYNDGTATATDVRASISAYDALGRVLIAAKVSVGTGTLARGASAVFEVLFNERAVSANRASAQADATP